MNYLMKPIRSFKNKELHKTIIAKLLQKELQNNTLQTIYACQKDTTTHNTDEHYNPPFQNELEIFFKMIQDIKKQHNSKLESLKNKVLGLGKKLEIKEKVIS